MAFTRDFKKLAYDVAIVGSLKLLKEFTEKSDNSELHQLKDWVMEIAFYVNSLHLNESGFDLVVNEQQQIVREKDLEIRKLKEIIRELDLNKQFQEHIDKNTL